jgi:hypothetical protein
MDILRALFGYQPNSSSQGQSEPNIASSSSSEQLGPQKPYEIRILSEDGKKDLTGAAFQHRQGNDACAVWINTIDAESQEALIPLSQICPHPSRTVIAYIYSLAKQGKKYMCHQAGSLEGAGIVRPYEKYRGVFPGISLLLKCSAPHLPKRWLYQIPELDPSHTGKGLSELWFIVDEKRSRHLPIYYFRVFPESDLSPELYDAWKEKKDSEHWLVQKPGSPISSQTSSKRNERLVLYTRRSPTPRECQPDFQKLLRIYAKQLRLSNITEVLRDFVMYHPEETKALFTGTPDNRKRECDRARSVAWKLAQISVGLPASPMRTSDVDYFGVEVKDGGDDGDDDDDDDESSEEKKPGQSPMPDGTGTFEQHGNPSTQKPNVEPPRPRSQFSGFDSNFSGFVTPQANLRKPSADPSQLLYINLPQAQNTSRTDTLPHETSPYHTINTSNIPPSIGRRKQGPHQALEDTQSRDCFSHSIYTSIPSARVDPVAPHLELHAQSLQLHSQRLRSRRPRAEPGYGPFSYRVGDEAWRERTERARAPKHDYYYDLIMDDDTAKTLAQKRSAPYFNSRQQTDTTARKNQNFSWADMLRAREDFELLRQKQKGGGQQQFQNLTRPKPARFANRKSEYERKQSSTWKENSLDSPEPLSTSQVHYEAPMDSIEPLRPGQLRYDGPDEYTLHGTTPRTRSVAPTPSPKLTAATAPTTPKKRKAIDQPDAPTLITQRPRRHSQRLAPDTQEIQTKKRTGAARNSTQAKTELQTMNKTFALAGSGKERRTLTSDNTSSTVSPMVTRAAAKAKKIASIKSAPKVGINPTRGFVELSTIPSLSAWDQPKRDTKPIEKLIATKQFGSRSPKSHTSVTSVKASKATSGLAMLPGNSITTRCASIVSENAASSRSSSSSRTIDVISLQYSPRFYLENVSDVSGVTTRNVLADMASRSDPAAPSAKSPLIPSTTRTRPVRSIKLTEKEIAVNTLGSKISKKSKVSTTAKASAKGNKKSFANTPAMTHTKTTAKPKSKAAISSQLVTPPPTPAKGIAKSTMLINGAHSLTKSLPATAAQPKKARPSRPVKPIIQSRQPTPSPADIPVSRQSSQYAKITAEKPPVLNPAQSQRNPVIPKLPVPRKAPVGMKQTAAKVKDKTVGKRCRVTKSPSSPVKTYALQQPHNKTKATGRFARRFSKTLKEDMVAFTKLESDGTYRTRTLI